MVVLESTTYPRTTEELIKPILEKGSTNIDNIRDAGIIVSDKAASPSALVGYSRKDDDGEQFHVNFHLE